MNMAISVAICILAVFFAVLIAIAFMQEINKKQIETSSGLTELGNSEKIESGISGAPFQDGWQATKEIAIAREYSA